MIDPTNIDFKALIEPKSSVTQTSDSNSLKELLLPIILFVIVVSAFAVRTNYIKDCESNGNIKEGLN